jgi:hypothetical protein
VEADAATVLAAYRQAAGGDALDRVRRLRATGVTYTTTTPSNQRLVLQVSVPGRFKQYEAPVDEKSQQTVMVVVLDGDSGWRMGNTRLGGRGQSADPAVRDRAITLAARQNYINTVSGILPLLLQADPAITITAAPAATSGPGRGAPALTITSVDGATGRLVFDPVTALPSTFTAPYRRDIRPDGGDYTLTFSDFRVVDGIKVPFQITRTSGAAPETRWSFNAIAINPEFDAKTFERPAR